MPTLIYNGKSVTAGGFILSSIPPSPSTGITILLAYTIGTPTIWRSEDGGANFTPDVSSASFAEFTVFCKDGTNIIVGDADGNIYNYSEGSLSAPTAISSYGISDIQVRGNIKVAVDILGVIYTI